MNNDASNKLYWRFNPAASEDAIQQIVERFTDLPLALKKFWQQSDGSESPNGIKLYSTDEIIERNETFEVAEYAPELLLIGDDSGGDGFFMYLELNATQVNRIDLGALGSSDGRKETDDFYDWITSNKVSNNIKENEVNFVNIYLSKFPKNGYKGLLDIKNKLKLSLSISELKYLSNELPTALLKSVYLSKYHNVIDELNSTCDCITYTRITQ